MDSKKSVQCPTGAGCGLASFSAKWLRAATQFSRSGTCKATLIYNSLVWVGNSTKLNKFPNRKLLRIKAAGNDLEFSPVFLWHSTAEHFHLSLQVADFREEGYCGPSYALECKARDPWTLLRDVLHKVTHD